MSRLVYGVHPVEEVLRRRPQSVGALIVARPAPGVASPGPVARRAPGVASPGPVARRGPLSALLALAEGRSIPVQSSTPEDLDALCGSTSHQGVVAVVGDYPYLELEDLLTAEPALLVVLDSVTDPQNLGAIIRSAAFLGATGLVIPKDRSASITPTVVRVSAGASEHLPCARVTNLARALAVLREAGIWIAGAVESGGALPESLDCGSPLAIVLGNEQKGIRLLVRKGCDVLVTIPPRSQVASLNVAAAATALLAEAARQRRSS